MSRSDPGGAAYLDLQRKAREAARPVQEFLSLYVLEAFVDRLSRTELREQLLLKGGVLLAAFGERRPTRDVDLHAEAMSNEAEVVLEAICSIARMEVDDGVVFLVDDAKAVVIRDGDAYSGVRVSMRARLATAVLTFHVDVSIGDPVIPAPGVVELPRLLGGSIAVRGYPFEMVHAEKIVTAVAFGTVNTRWRDFVDVVNLAARLRVDGGVLVRAVNEVATHRKIELEPPGLVLDGYGAVGQQKWAAWRRNQNLEDTTPERFEDLLQRFLAFADPAVTGSASGMRWDPFLQTWS